jgi:2-polyprenyl-3-methyl-5-hydroxy-6-metoxy-1,4-benzoquinol methylase
MGVEQGPEFYDGRLGQVCVELETSPWLRLYTMVLSVMPPPSAGPVADLGCGTGRFAKLLQQNGYTDYWGVDFSEKRVEEARRYVPEFEFEVANLFDPAVLDRLANFRVFTIIEVLEHVNDDLGLLSRLPSGGQVVLSVPNFDSAGHVRCFEDVESVIARYEDLVDFTGGPRLTKVGEKNQANRTFVVAGVRR